MINASSYPMIMHRAQVALPFMIVGIMSYIDRSHELPGHLRMDPRDSTVFLWMPMHSASSTVAQLIVP